MNWKPWLLFALLTASCSDDDIPPDELMGWINNSEHKLISVQSRGNMTWGISYVPYQYLAWQYLNSLDGYTEITRDSILKSYSHSLCLMLSVEEKSGEETIQQSADAAGTFEENATRLNFELPGMISLNYGKGDLSPVLSTVESSFGPATRRNMMLIFPKADTAWGPNDTLVCTLDDKIFDSGRFNFTIAARDIEQIPPIDRPRARHANRKSL